MKQRSWKNYRWSEHALERIAEYHLRLNNVFSDFEHAEKVDRSEEQILRDFSKSDWIKRKERSLLDGQNYGFIVKEEQKIVVTVINHRLRKSQKELRKETDRFVVEIKNGVKKLKPIL